MSITNNDLMCIEKIIGKTRLEIFNKLKIKISSLYGIEAVFKVDGKKWDYVYKYCKGNKTLWAFYFKQDVIGFMIIFGKAEREKFEVLRTEFSTSICNLYDAAATFHDGKWVMFEPENMTSNDVELLLKIKSKPDKT